MDLLPGLKVEESAPEPKKICVIGAGAGGLAALKIIKDSAQYKSGIWSVIAFEARGHVGGIWVPAPATEDPPLTPLYDSLTTNIPHPMMAYTSYSFPPSTPVYPRASVVRDYLESYATHFDLVPHIRFNISVTKVERQLSSWRVLTSTGETSDFDLVVVANGHYRVPRYPDTPGLDSWLQNKKATHSAWYRNSRDFSNFDSVLVVGSGPSGTDIAAEMRSVAKTVIHSVTGAKAEDMGNFKRRGRVAEYRASGDILFQDGSVESGVDHVILATGYKMDFPFLSEDVLKAAFPPAIPPLPRDLYNSTYHIFPLGRHLFPLQANFPSNSLVFMCLLMKVVPFPLLEAQAHAVVHAFANPEALNPTAEAVDIMSRYEELRAASAPVALDDSFAIARSWHRFKGNEQWDYRDRLYELAFSPGDEKRVVVQQWEKDAYEKKEALRKVWTELERNGQAEEWVTGVGEGGPQEWVDLLRRMLRKADEQLDERVFDEKPKL